MIFAECSRELIIKRRSYPINNGTMPIPERKPVGLKSFFKGMIGLPKCLIVYFSQEGSTAKVGEAIASGLRSKGYEVNCCNLKDEQPQDVSGYDLIGIGTPVYYFRPPYIVIDYVKSLLHIEGICVFYYLLYGTYSGEAIKPIRKIIQLKGATEVGYFQCRGSDYFLGYLKRGFLFSANHPTKSELKQAEEFGCKASMKVSQEKLQGHSLGVMYRLERLLSNRWLNQQIYSRYFRITNKCKDCGLCIKKCPSNNISKDVCGKLIRGRDCLLCLSCEMKCPNEAIESIVSSILFRPFISYNISRAVRDRGSNYVMVEHQFGRTTRLKTGAGDAFTISDSHIL